jgi:hypothetical protein
VTIFGPVANFPVPSLPARDYRIHVPEKFFRVNPGIYYAVILPQQLIGRVPANFAKFAIDRGNASLRVGSGYNGVLIQHCQNIFEFNVVGRFALD